MKVCVFGSRDLNSSAKINEIHSILDSFHKTHGITTIVSGGARGVDNHGEIWAKKNNIKIVMFPAQWGLYGKKAGPLRNENMADFCDYGLGFSLNNSRGTANMVSNLVKYKKPYKLYEYKENN